LRSFGLSAIFSYLVSQIFFSVLIMDHMSRITEQLATGRVEEPENIALPTLFGLSHQTGNSQNHHPRVAGRNPAAAGLAHAPGAFITILSSGIAAVFLAWDNTDLIPARRMNPFGRGFDFFWDTLSFHLGFGLLFLIPGLNLLLLSFAPVGATLYHLEKDTATPVPTP
jgi:CysZ protein